MHDAWADDLIGTYGRITRARVGQLAQTFLSDGRVAEDPADQIEQAAGLLKALTGHPFLIEALVWRERDFAAREILEATGLTPTEAYAAIDKIRERQGKPGRWTDAPTSSGEAGD